MKLVSSLESSSNLCNRYQAYKAKEYREVKVVRKILYKSQYFFPLLMVEKRKIETKSKREPERERERERNAFFPFFFFWL